MRLSLLCVSCIFWAYAGAAAPALHVTQQGEGPVVLFLGGLNVHGDMWRPWADTLAQGHRVLVVTPAGFAGVAPAELDGGFFATYVPALARLLEEQQAEGTVVVGHSLGGLAALMLAVETERVGRLLIVDSLPFVAELFLPGATPAQAAQTAERLATRSMALGQDAYLAETERPIANAAESVAFRERLRTWAAASHRATVVTAFKEMLATDFRSTLSSIQQPVQVLAAWDASMPLTKEAVEALYGRQYQGLPRGEVRVVEDALHFLMIDQPAAFESSLATVLTP